VHAGIPRASLPAALLIGALALALVGLAGCNVTSLVGQSNGGVDARIGAAEPFTYDPAHAGDAGSANVIGQIFEGLTTFDADSNVRPALADAWQVSGDGQRITFHLRPGIEYSDGSPITAQDVVDSWFRLIDPETPSPLSSLLADVDGATEYQAGNVGRDAVGLHTAGDQVIVDLAQPATYFPSVTASPSLAVVPPSMYDQLDAEPPSDVVVSGAYVPSLPTAGVIRLTANPHYWAGPPPLATIELVTDFANKSGVDLFSSGDLDYTSVGSGDASWIKYDDGLGPQLRQIDSFSVSYYGFNTHTPPFDDVRVRLAFAEAVDWDRIVRLGDGLPATSMVPVGVPGRDEVDHRPAYDPTGAKDLLAQAGFTGGRGFPTVTISTYGVGFEETVAAELAQTLGVTVNVDIHDFADFPNYLADSGNPQMWTLSWIADYPHPNDFLGLLLQSRSTSNFGGWSDSAYDALITQAAATADLQQQQTLYGQAQTILAQQAPVVPAQYDQSFALGRAGLQGALESGVGFIRLAGLDWTPGTGR
jgi:ABC-type oligopeptide transport system substrate-binding subunit